MKDDFNYSAEKIDLISYMRYHFIAMHLLDNSFKTYRDVARLSEEFEFRMSDSAVSRMARDMRFKARLQQPKEKLSVEQKRYRVKFSREIKKNILLPYSMDFL